MESEDLLTLAEAVEFLGTSKPTMYRWLERGEVKGLKVGKQWRFRKADLVAYMERGPVAIAAAPAAELEAETAFFAQELQRVGGPTPLPLDEEPGVGEEGIDLLARQILTLAIKEGSTDIHLEPVRFDGEAHLLLRIRIDGRLHEIRRMPIGLHEALTAYLKQSAGMELSERRMPQDGRIPVTDSGRKFELRVSCLLTLHGEAVVMRILDRTNAIVGLDKLGLAPEDREAIEGLLKQPNGILLAVGPVGSGKTTLLYSALQKIAGADRKSLSVEEYVEHVLPYVTPIRINRRTGVNYAAALRALMRHDPDVVLIGELPDLETVQLAQMVSLTGQLVLAPLYAHSATDAIRRLLDLGAEPFQVPASLIGIVCQRLVRTICAECRQPYEVAAEELKGFGFDEEGLSDKVTLWRGAGCDVCRNTGYKGRTGLFEVLSVGEALARAILCRASAEELTEIALVEGMRPLIADGLRKCLEGVTTPYDVMRVMAVGL
jgi:excisionase family DNA binding protein